MNWYERKRDEAHAKWTDAVDAKDDKGADKWMTEYLNYCELVKEHK